MAKKISEQLGKAFVNSNENISTKKVNKAQYDKSYKTTIVGCNRYFTDDVPVETQAELIKKYNIPEVSESGVYYTFRINGNWYVKSSNNDFKLYEEVVVRVPNGNWDNMFIEVQRDTIVEDGSGVGKNVGNDSEIFNRYEGSNANVIDGGYAAHAEGSQNTITGASFTSHAEGSENRISNSRGAHAEGNFTSISNSDYSHTEGQSNHIYGASCAHAGGYGSHIMSGADCGFAHGYGARVLGAVSAALGYQTLASGRNQLVAGEGNIEDTEDKYSLIIGNGTGIRGLSGFAPSNALTLDRDGNLWVAGTISAEGGGTGGTTYTAGDGISIADSKISVKPATKTTLGGVKAGDGIDISSDGTISTENKQSLTAGSGIEITDENSINLKQATGTEIGGIILGEGLEYDAATGKTNTVPNIQQAVIITEADAKYLLHEYTQVEYIAGNKIGYAGAQNQIIAQGYIIYKNGGTAPNGVKIANIAVSDPSGLPDIPMYTDMPFSGSAYFNNTVKTVRAYMKLMSSSNVSDNYSVFFAFEDGTEKIASSRIYNYDNFQYGLSFVWTGIYPPGYTVSGVTHPYGAVQAQAYYKAKTSQTGTAAYRFQPSDALMIDFASEAEYNAAVGLTYEPQTLVNVEETITEV